MKMKQMIKSWMTHGGYASKEMAEWLRIRGNEVAGRNEQQPRNDGTKYTMVNVESFFANIKPNPSRIFRFIAVLRGKTRSDPATVMFECNKKLKCGTTLNSFDGKKYIIVERKLKNPIPSPT